MSTLTLLNRVTRHLYTLTHINAWNLTIHKATVSNMGPSGLAKIENLPDHPIELFRTWRDEARKYRTGLPDVFCLATVSNECKPSARNVVLRHFDNDSLVFVTDSRSRKAKNIESCNYVATCFLWEYVNDEQRYVSKQTRIEGELHKLDRKDFEHYYERDSLFAKIRAHICNQGQEVDWDELNQRHNELLQKIQNGEVELKMPESMIGYKLLPKVVEFYYAETNLIADRIYYKRENYSSPWNHHRIAA